MKNKFILSSLVFLFASLILLIYPQVSLAAISVTTNAASATSTEATLNGATTDAAAGIYDGRGFNFGTASANAGEYNIGSSTESGAYTAPDTFTPYATTSLTRGEVYYFRAYISSSTAAADGFPSITYGTEQQFMTGLYEPTDLAAVPGQSLMSLSWTTTTGAHTVYVEVRYSPGAYPTSISGGTQACQVNGTTCTLDGLTCGTTYYFRAWATTTDTVGGMSTSSDSYSQLAQSTSGCAGTSPTRGGRTLTAPTTFSDSSVIAGGATSTEIREVTLTLKASNVLLMTICNDPNFIGCWLEDYDETKSWTLTEGDGLKTVYVKFVSPDGMNSEVISATITLKTVVEEVIEEAPAEEVVEEAPTVEEVEEEEVVEEVETPISEMTIDEIQGKIAQIMAQIKLLQEQLVEVKAAEKISGCTISSFDRNLKQGMSGSDVKCLQIVLNSSADTKIAASGVGSAGDETTYFGALTKAAVIKFQKKYASEILAAWGLTSGNGFIGQTTRAKLNEILGK